MAETIAKQVTELERVSQMSREEARNTLLEQLKQELQQEQIRLIRENEIKIRESAEEKSREILSQVMQNAPLNRLLNQQFQLFHFQ